MYFIYLNSSEAPAHWSETSLIFGTNSRIRIGIYICEELDLETGYSIPFMCGTENEILKKRKEKKRLELVLTSSNSPFFFFFFPPLKNQNPWLFDSEKLKEPELSIISKRSNNRTTLIHTRPCFPALNEYIWPCLIKCHHINNLFRLQATVGVMLSHWNLHIPVMIIFRMVWYTTTK